MASLFDVIDFGALITLELVTMIITTNLTRSIYQVFRINIIFSTLKKQLKLLYINRDMV